MNPFFNESNDSTVHSDGLTCLVYIESAVLNESFDMNDSVSHLLKQELTPKVPTQKHIQQNIV